jgi:phosphohistidine phosphatase
MKTLFLIRHAKSSWAEPEMKDFDRPLNDRGNENAPFMGKLLKKEKIFPDLIISSPAKRAITTARKIADEIDYPKNKIVEEPKIYEANVKTLLQIINSLADENETVFLFGHNPSFTEFLGYLTEAYISNIPTCGIAQIEFENDTWKEVSRETGTMKNFFYPKMFE